MGAVLNVMVFDSVQAKKKQSKKLEKDSKTFMVKSKYKFQH